MKINDNVLAIIVMLKNANDSNIFRLTLEKKSILQITMSFSYGIILFFHDKHEFEVVICEESIKDRMVFKK